MATAKPLKLLKWLQGYINFYIQLCIQFGGWIVGWEINIPFSSKIGYIGDKVLGGTQNQVHYITLKNIN